MLTDFGLVGCGQWAVLTDRMKLLLQQAEGLGLTGTAGYISAKAYYDDKVGWFKTAVLLGSHCEEEVREANDRINALNAAITGTGNPLVIVGHNVDAPPPTEDLSTTLKWVVGGAVAISLAVVAVKVVPLISLFKKPKRSYSGYRRRRRR